MKHLKMLGLLVMTTASLMAFASSASAAPVLTSPAGVEYTGEIHATMEPRTSSIMKAGIEDTCTETTVKGTVTVNNATHAEGPATVISNGSAGTPCSRHMATLKTGSLAIADNGTVSAANNEVTINDTSLGISCVYGGGSSPGTNIGTLTGGSPAKLAVNTTKMKKISGSFFCASEGTWTANYVVTTPSTLLIT
ncbi:MAG: hypothetical protein ACTHNY_00715 [Solirubrobacterales bacterium]